MCMVFIVVAVIMATKMTRMTLSFCLNEYGVDNDTLKFQIKTPEQRMLGDLKEGK